MGISKECVLVGFRHIWLKQFAEVTSRYYEFQLKRIKKLKGYMKRIEARLS